MSASWLGAYDVARLQKNVQRSTANRLGEGGAKPNPGYIYVGLKTNPKMAETVWRA